jgi:hypothetical protein
MWRETEVRFEYMNADETMILASEGAGGVLLEPGMPGWLEVVLMKPAPFVPPALPDPLEVERAGMVVSRFQARAALHYAGKLQEVEAFVKRADFITQMAWSEAQEFRRTSPTMAALAGLLGMDDAALDDLFRAAGKIEV